MTFRNLRKITSIASEERGELEKQDKRYRFSLPRTVICGIKLQNFCHNRAHRFLQLDLLLRMNRARTVLNRGLKKSGKDIHQKI
jgi:hypothetical protein